MKASLSANSQDDDYMETKLRAKFENGRPEIFSLMITITKLYISQYKS